MKHIEFMGLPGSGKTTLWNETIPILKRMGYKAMGLEEAFCYCLLERVVDRRLRIIKPFPYIIRKNICRHYSRITKQEAKAYNRFLIEHPILAQTVLTALHEHSRSSGKHEEITNWIYRFFSRYDTVIRNIERNEIVVLDEGFCNRAVLLFVNPEKRMEVDLIQRYARTIPIPDILFVVRSRLEICITRMESREDGFPQRIATCSKDKKKQFLKNAGSCLSIVQKVLREKDCKVVQINNNGPKDNSVKEINKYLKANNRLSL